jgi:hypothetical protein
LLPSKRERSSGWTTRQDLRRRGICDFIALVAAVDALGAALDALTTGDAAAHPRHGFWFMSGLDVDATGGTLRVPACTSHPVAL